MASVPKEESYQRHLKALQLRLAGRSYDDIASALGYANRSVAFKAVASAMQKTLREPADQLRNLETDRIDKALSAVWARVLKGDDKAIQTFLRLSEQRSKLLGLYVPARMDITSNGNDIVIPEKIDDERFDRAISSLADAIRESVSSDSPRENGSMDTTEQAAMDGPAI